MKIFVETYKREYGFELKNRDIIVDDLRVRAIARSRGLKKVRLVKKKKINKPENYTRCYFSDIGKKESGWIITHYFF